MKKATFNNSTKENQRLKNSDKRTSKSNANQTDVFQARKESIIALVPLNSTPERRARLQRNKTT